jgi:hypothetical protein
MFTKVVTHRSRRTPLREKTKQTLAVLHVLAVVSAAIAMLASLIATDWPSAADGPRIALRIAAWSELGFASAILIVDITIDAFFLMRGRGRVIRDMVSSVPHVRPIRPAAPE